VISACHYLQLGKATLDKLEFGIGRTEKLERVDIR